MTHEAASPSFSALLPARGTQRRILMADARHLALRARTLIGSDHLALRLTASAALIAGVAVAVLKVSSMVADL